MSLVADDLETMVVGALPGDTEDENNGYLRELIDRLQARIRPGSPQPSPSGDPATDHPFFD